MKETTENRTGIDKIGRIRWTYQCRKSLKTKMRSWNGEDEVSSGEGSRERVEMNKS